MDSNLSLHLSKTYVNGTDFGPMIKQMFYSVNYFLQFVLFDLEHLNRAWKLK